MADDQKPRNPFAAFGIGIAVMAGAGLIASFWTTVHEIHVRHAAQRPTTDRTIIANEDGVDLGIFQATMAGIALLGVGLTAFYAKRAADAAQDSVAKADQTLKLAQKSHEAEHRPWLAMKDFEIKGSLYFQGIRAFANITYTLENVGTAPAIEFLLHGKVISNAQQRGINGYIKDLYEEYRVIKRSNISELVPATVIFPRQSITEQLLQLDFEIENAITEMGNSHLFSPMLILVGCYKSPFDDEAKYTSCVFVIGIDGAAMQIGMPDQELVPIPPERLALRPWHTGRRAI